MNIDTIPTQTQDLSKAEPDYYIEHGLLVFTAAYHLRRGYCCKSGCRHCPYGYDKQHSNAKTK